MIKVTNLTKKYGERYAINNISFEVNDGEVVGFLGPNGAGKTTTMNIITGYISSTSGTAEIDGYDILENPTEAKKQIGYLPEFPPLYLEMTVNEYLGFIFDLKKCTLKKKDHIDEICRVVKITDAQKRLIKNLSKGYRQRVGIAGALVGNPKVVIFDEPTNGLDPRQIIDIRNLIKKLGEDHTVILSTHILSEVKTICDRIIIINEGKIVADTRRPTLKQRSKETEDLKSKLTVQSHRYSRHSRKFQVSHMLQLRRHTETAYLHSLLRARMTPMSESPCFMQWQKADGLSFQWII